MPAIRCSRSARSDPDGQVRASLGVEAFRRAAGGRFTSLPRGDLAAAIYATIEHDVETIFGDSITAINEHPDGVCVSFAQAKTRDFDLVIGADGLHSNVRRLDVRSRVADVEHYLGCLVAACVVEGYRPRDELAYVTHSEPGRSVGRFSLRGDRAMFLFVFRSHQAADPGELAARKALLRREFGDAGWECPHILAALDGVDDLYFDVVSQIRLDRWSRGRIGARRRRGGVCLADGGGGHRSGDDRGLRARRRTPCARGDYRRAFDAYEARLRPFVEANRLPGGSLSPSSQRRRGWASGFATWQCGR